MLISISIFIIVAVIIALLIINSGKHNTQEDRKVNKIVENAKLVCDLSSKLTFKDLKIYKGYNDESLSLDYFIEYKNKRYDLKDYDLEPITLLPNNYLMVEYFNIEELRLGEIKYINLKTGLIDENYSLEFEEYYDDGAVYLITK